MFNVAYLFILCPLWEAVPQWGRAGRPQKSVDLWFNPQLPSKLNECVWRAELCREALC